MDVYYENEGTLSTCISCKHCTEHGYDGAYRDMDYVMCHVSCPNEPKEDCFKCKSCKYYQTCKEEYKIENDCH